MAETGEAMTEAGSGLGNAGALARKVIEFTQLMRRLVPTIRTPADWSPLAAFVAVDEFVRHGCFLEVQDWQQYIGMLSAWASATATFEITVRRVTEHRDLVFYEIEERHHRGDSVTVVNSMTVFAFNEHGKICRLDVYLQQPR